MPPRPIQQIEAELRQALGRQAGDVAQLNSTLEKPEFLIVMAEMATILRLWHELEMARLV